MGTKLSRKTGKVKRLISFLGRLARMYFHWVASVSNPIRKRDPYAPRVDSRNVMNPACGPSVQKTEARFKAETTAAVP